MASKRWTLTQAIEYKRFIKGYAEKWRKKIFYAGRRVPTKSNLSLAGRDINHLCFPSH